MPTFIESLEDRRLLSAAITPTTGKYKGTSVSAKNFTSRLVMSLGKERAGGTIIGTFNYLNQFNFTMHLRLGSDNTFHGTIIDGNLTGTISGGVITTASKGTIIDLSGKYSFTSKTSTGDSGTFLVRS